MKQLKPNRKTKLLVLYALYVTFILLSTIPYLAEQDLFRGKIINDEYESHLRFTEDGEYGHYKKVILYNNSNVGLIDLTYKFETNTLFIQELENIKELTIDCKLMYENKYEEVFGEKPIDKGPEYYKTYFAETKNGVFKVIINTDEPIEKLQFLNVPIPVSVLVDGDEWWETETEYYTSNGNDVTISYIPKGSTTVEIQFKEITKIGPVALFTANKYALPDEEIYFDATGSYDEDGEIISYTWELGDGTEDTGEIVKYTYSKIGTYEVTLTVKDNDNLIESISESIYIVESGVDTDNDGVVNELDPNPFENLDTDGDTLSNDYEDVISNTNKTVRDTDGDGWDDNVELSEGFDPLKSESHPDVTKAEKKEEQEPGGMFGMGVGVDAGIIIVIVIIIILILLFLIKKRKVSSGLEEEPPDKEDRKKPPVSTQLISGGARPPAVKPHMPPTTTTAPKSVKTPTRPSSIPSAKPIIKKPMSVKSPPVKKPKESKPKPKIAPKLALTPEDLEEQSPADYKKEVITELMESLHLSKSRAAALFDGGYISLSQLENASKDDLMKIKGIGPKMASMILRNVEDYKKKK